jgi:hypothetical protein
MRYKKGDKVRLVLKPDIGWTDTFLENCFKNNYIFTVINDNNDYYMEIERTDGYSNIWSLSKNECISIELANDYELPEELFKI